jgi:dipeptidyl aminopeptidase/acylaminoacyl peptidase
MPTNATLGLCARIGGGLILLFLLARTSDARSSRWQITSVAVSPDGRLIALAAEKGSTSFIYRVPVDTGVATRLTGAKDGEETSPTFSPDGKRIAYCYEPGDHTRSRIVMVNVDGSDMHQWSPSSVTDLSPVLSPDNETIVFSRADFYGSYSPVAQPHPHGWNFFAANLDGTNLRQLTTEHFYMVSRPAVSPDGKNMVVVAERLDTDQQIAIYSITSPGPPVRTLRPHVPKEISRRHPIFAYPNYLPDGSILFMAANEHVDYDVYRLNPDTGAIEQLTNRNGYATELKVSADGKTAAFLKWRKNWKLEVTAPEPYLLDLESLKLTPLEISGLN